MRSGFASRLKAALSERGMSQSELARAADIGRDSVSTYCAGKTLPEPRNLKRIAHALNISPSELLPGGTSAAPPSLLLRAVDENHVYITINRQITLEQAAKIFEILNDKTLDAE